MNKFQNVDWSSIYGLDASEAAAMLRGVVLSLDDECFPTKTVKANPQTHLGSMILSGERLDRKNESLGGKVEASVGRRRTRK